VPLLKRPDGVEIHWEQRGESGRLAVLTVGAISHPPAFEGLVSDLAADHRVVTWDLRGTGSSTRQGPYDMETDASDLEALVEERGGEAVSICVASGVSPAVRVAVRRPELVTEVVCPGGGPLNRAAISGGEGLAGSDSVVDMTRQMLRNDFRGAVRALIGTLNPQLDEEAVRERVRAQIDYSPQEAVVERLDDWIADDTERLGRELGERLWILHHGNDPWFPIDTLRVMRERLPDAHTEEVPDGPVSRPDLTAAVVRGITSRPATSGSVAGGKGRAAGA
jgi:pimeloyl-ACP methyl ester carboxylesterase